MTTPEAQRDDRLGSWPVNVIIRQWRKAKTQTGWRRVVSVTRVGCEVALVVVVIAFLII
jgi:hypothetical protein